MLLYISDPMYFTEFIEKKMSQCTLQLYLSIFSCCEPTKFGLDLVQLPCKDGTKIRAAFKFPIECICRPCTTVNDHVSDMARAESQEIL